MSVDYRPLREYPTFATDDEMVAHYVAAMPLPDPETAAHLARLLGLGLGKRDVHGPRLADVAGADVATDSDAA